MNLKNTIAAILVCGLTSCTDSGLYEKVMFMPEAEWSYSNQPVFNFQVSDTASSYQVYFLVRHSDAYAFNNIWISLSSKLPGDSVARSSRFDIRLANEKGWLGSGMDDIFNHRILLYPEPVKFAKPGSYEVTIAQDMRTDPLKHILNVGLRLEKVR